MPSVVASESSSRSKAVLGALGVLALGAALATSWMPVRWASEAPDGALADPGRVRSAVGAGQFYPSDPEELAVLVDQHLAEAPGTPVVGLRALVVPHDRYEHTAGTLGLAYRQLEHRDVRTVYLLGPSHEATFVGVSIPDVDGYATALGTVPLSARAEALRRVSPFTSVTKAHTTEHVLEVQLPFLQRALGQFELVPLVFGKVDARAVAQALDPELDEQSFVIATAAPHHDLPDERARRLHGRCLTAAAALDVAAVAHAEACGKLPVLTVLHLADLRGWKAELLNRRGEAGSAKERTVGSAAIAFFETE